MMGNPVAALVFTLLLTGCVNGMPTIIQAPQQPPSAPSAVPSNLEGDVHRLINAHRARAGLSPLQYDERIAAIAREHSRAMAEKRRAFGHDGFDGRAAAVGQLVPISGFAENVAYNSRTGAELAPSVSSGWIASPGHRQNIEGTFTLTGVGAFRSSDGATYFTQLFVR